MNSEFFHRIAANRLRSLRFRRSSTLEEQIVLSLSLSRAPLIDDNLPSLLAGGRPPRGALQGARRRHREDQRAPERREEQGRNRSVHSSRQSSFDLFNLFHFNLDFLFRQAADPVPRQGLLPLRAPRQQAHQRAAGRVRVRGGGGEALRREGAAGGGGGVGGRETRAGRQGGGRRECSEGGDGEIE